MRVYTIELEYYQNKYRIKKESRFVDSYKFVKRPKRLKNICTNKVGRYFFFNHKKRPLWEGYLDKVGQFRSYTLDEDNLNNLGRKMIENRIRHINNRNEKNNEEIDHYRCLLEELNIEDEQK